MELSASTFAPRFLIPVGDDQSQVGEAKRSAAELAELLGFDQTSREKAILVVSELASNLHKHSAGGAILIHSYKVRGTSLLEVLSIDKGPGINDLSEALADGYSTAGTLGTGLGAVKRLSTEFDAHSTRQKGTVIASRIIAENTPLKSMSFGGLCFPKPGETVSGDNWGMVETEDGVMIMVADGLGHGHDAGEASQAAVSLMFELGITEPMSLMQKIHPQLKSTRGAAVSIALYQKQTRVLRYAALGNVASAIVGPEKRQILFNQDGTAGYQAPTIRQQEYELPIGQYLIMHSDGCGSRWDLNAYQEWFGKSSSTIAGLLFRDFTKGNDDITIIALRAS